MRNMKITLLITLAMVIALPVSAATIAHWDFEDGVAGEPFTPEGVASGSGYSADLVAGYPMYGWDSYYGASYSDLTPSGEGLSMNVDANHQDGYAGAEALTTWSPSVWTIEVAVYLEEMDGWDTIIGRDGSAAGNAASDFYLSNDGEDDTFRIDFMTVGGERWVLDSDFVPVINQWYRIAVTCDGETLNMYCDKMDGEGFLNVGTLDISSQSVADNALAESGFNWTFGRGWYDGNFVDHIDGYIDDIRFSDEVLDTTEFLGADLSAYAPDPQPYHPEDGTVGNIHGDKASLSFNFKAGPGKETAVNPDILVHYIYHTKGDGSGDMIETPYTVTHSDYSDPNVSYGPLLLEQGTEYEWYVEEGLDDGSGNPKPAGDPNNYYSPTWSFTTVSHKPGFVSGPENTVADENGNCSLTVEGTLTAETYQWFDGETDAPLSDGGIYSGTTTQTLTITGGTIDDEGEVYCVCYNGDTSSDPVYARWYMPRLIGHWKFDGNLEDSVNDVYPSVPSNDGVLTVHDSIAGPGDPNYASTEGQTAIDGDAAWFFNDGDFVEIPNQDYYNFYHDGFTFSCWYKMDETAGWTHPIIRLETGNSSVSGFLFGIDTGNRQDCRFIIENALGWPGLNSDNADDPVAYNDGEWHMMTAAYDPDDGTAKLYADGAFVEETGVDMSSLGYPDAPIRIGGSNLDGNPAIQGGVDDVRIYSYALSDEEVADLYVDFKPDEYVCIAPEGSDLDTYDLNGDCRVNISDFALVALDWLKCSRVPYSACDWE
ncbi:LamG domain-containing protein [Sedimentisphaera salicampi]|uniref:LamG domain-containing protein n=1 Tax=Sedimentisphaera salicampi TaxID=1941349 RepID=UPI000B9C2B3C|nr:LamG-like jellyroll fold domain-containing protein [Sedimentisphaera salicampi]OXU14089.1 hypothetical protein SMSP1_02251 [Sedimentisphaera salicampi]